ncbi:hypothetical protein ACG98H_07870 [Corynebacterium sp. L4756]|uniref:hypothetical protein n=1 Tax=unclassified Corynebacterium TaxID=2624378 RepID=UPI00374D84A0
MTKTTYQRPKANLTGARGYQALADAWNIPVDDLYTDAYREARADAKAWQELTFTAGGKEVAQIIATTPRDKWLAEIKKQAADSVAAELIKEGHPRISFNLSRAADKELTGDAAWRHAATVLDVDKAVQDFQNAVSDLGTTVYDPIKAAQKNPTAFAEYMRRSPQLLFLDVLGASGRDSAALHASFPEIPVLTFSKDGFNRKTNHYTEEEINVHRVALAYFDKARNDDNILIDLVLGEYPGFELATSLNPNEYRRRRELMSEVNKIEQV